MTQGLQPERALKQASPLLIIISMAGGTSHTIQTFRGTILDRAPFQGLYHILGSQSGGTLYCGLPFKRSGLETRRRVLPATSITSRCFWHSMIFQSGAAVATAWARTWFFFGMIMFSILFAEMKYATAGAGSWPARTTKEN
jgi:hypothetical protein